MGGDFWGVYRDPRGGMERRKIRKNFTTCDPGAREDFHQEIFGAGSASAVRAPLWMLSSKTLIFTSTRRKQCRYFEKSPKGYRQLKKKFTKICRNFEKIRKGFQRFTKKILHGSLAGVNL
jgi:hypothetical protein